MPAELVACDTMLLTTVGGPYLAGGSGVSSRRTAVLNGDTES